MSKETRLERLKKRFRRIRIPLFAIPCIFSFGSGAGNILKELSIDGMWKIAVNSSQRDLDMIEKQVDLTIPCGDGSGSGMDPKRGRRDVLDVVDDLPMVVDEACAEFGHKEPDIIFTIHSLGHGFGSGSLPIVLRSFKAAFKDAVLIPFCVTPFLFEGEPVMLRASDALRKAIKVTTLFPISNEYVVSQVGIDPTALPISDVYDTINKQILLNISSLINALTAREGVLQSFDRADLRKLVSGELGTIASYRCRSASAVEAETIDEVERRSFLPIESTEEEKILKLTYLIDGKGKVSVAQMRHLSSEFNARYPIDRKLLKPLIIQRPLEDCGFTVITCGFKYELKENIRGLY